MYLVARPAVSDARTNGVFRARRLHAFMRLAPALGLANCANALLIAWVFADRFSRGVGDMWLGAVLLTAAGLTLLWWRRYRAGPPAESGKRDVVVVCLFSFAMAGLYGLAIISLFPRIDPVHQTVIAVLGAGLISAGSQARATVLPAALTWLFTLNVACIIALLEASNEVSVTTIALLLTFDATILTSVQSFSRLYTARLRSEADAAHQQDVVRLLLRDFEAHASDWLWECDENACLTRVSPRMAEVIGQPVELILYTNLCDLFKGDGEPLSTIEHHTAESMRQRFSVPTPFRDYVVAVDIDGALRWWSLSATPMLDSMGRHVGWRGVGADMTESLRAQSQLQLLASRDGLTGLLNRHRFQSLLFDLMDRGERRFALLLIDLDNFKAINDTLGHSVGDELLRHLAQRFAPRVHTAAPFARLGGDEFAVIEPAITSGTDACALANDVLAVLGEPCLIDGARIEVRASIGVALFPDHGSTPDLLLKNADAALYAAKEAGGNRAHLFDESLGMRLQQRMIMVQDLSQALSLNQLRVVYQPQVDAATGAVIAFEALLRWDHPVKGALSPALFIPIAEETGQIVALGAWVLEQACRDALDWPEPAPKVAVNLSAVQLNSRSIVETVASILERTGLPGSRLELEVTESALIQDDVATRATLNAFRGMDIEIALDDFGIGYSVLSYLQTFPFDKLKIDRSFVMVLAEPGDIKHSAIFRAIIDLARALDLQTVAEGIDSPMTLSAVRAQGCHVFQGFLFAEPMPASDIASFLRRSPSWTVMDGQGNA